MSSMQPMPLERRLDAAIDQWKRKLLDLTKRNRALNFKPTKVATITITGEQPAEVFRHLYIRQKPMRFGAVPERGGSPRATTTEVADVELDIEDTEEIVRSETFTPYDRSELKDQHTDDILQTNRTADRLDKSLRRLSELAQSTIDEQGVNTLFLALGMLYYTESKDSDVVFQAPLILLPVELVRESARTGYKLQAAEDEPVVNPALAEFLRRDFGLQVPELPDSESMPDDYDLQAFFSAFRNTIRDQAKWEIKNDIYLNPFSFQKLVMYKDLDANGAAFATHRLIRQIVGRSGGTIAGLPEEIRNLVLDQEFPPESTFQVVDADSSQLRALAAVARDHDLVMEGPPGTGKSQTITNLIAQAMAAGKSVLFVCEKMAALQVVYSRLRAAGLHEFCLEIHSTKANKRSVIQDIAATLDSSLVRCETGEASGPRLREVRNTLTAYSKAVHTEFGKLGISPYRAYGELGTTLGAGKVPLTIGIDQITYDQFQSVLRDLNDLAVHARAIGDVSQHPWRDCTRTLLTEDDVDTLAESLRRAAERLTDLTARASVVSEQLGLPPLTDFSRVDGAVLIGTVLSESPGAPTAVLESSAWNTPPAEATSIVARGREIAQLKHSIGQKFQQSVVESDHSSDIAYMEQKLQGGFAFLAFLDGRYRSIRKRWVAYRGPGYLSPIATQVADMKVVQELRRQRQALQSQEALARSLFGALWNGENSNWNSLDVYTKWVVQFRTVCMQHGMSAQIVAAATQPHARIEAVHQLKESQVQTSGVLASLCTFLGWSSKYFQADPLSVVVARVEALANALHLGHGWVAFEDLRQQVAAGPAAETLDAAMKGSLPFSEVRNAFSRAFFQKWLSSVVHEREELRRFTAMTHEQRVLEFQDLDRAVLQQNRTTLISTLRDRVQNRLQSPDVLASMPFLRKEMARQRGLSPLRKTMKEASPAIRAIKPCFMMSPLTVAQYVGGTQPTFDLVVFDEASQLPTEDSVGALIRGRQLTVVGDPKQLPPTNFFAVMGGQMAPLKSVDGEILFEDSESILEEFMASGAPQARLKWHYRSSHESLINFSNVSFYDSELFTFPSVETDSHSSGLQFEYIADGIYEGEGINRVEARRVADAVVHHAKASPELSLGVGTFNLRQQLAILDELEVRRRQDPSLESFFASRPQEGFFVKNLENIQGDERDVIFLSVTYAKGHDGRLRYQFGPLNSQNGWRRLNVLTTRARKRMKVFSSIRSQDIQTTQTDSVGAKLLHDFLRYAELGKLDNPCVAASAGVESPFEREVYRELTKHGLTLVPQVGVAGYRVDFGVLDDVFPGRYVCGLECDGVAYHSSETARDRDRLRQQVLEDRGWIIHRVWSTDWFKNRTGQVERILKLVEEARASLNAAKAKPLQEEAPSAPMEVGTNPTTPLSYIRPVAKPYTITPGQARYAGEDLLTAPESKLVSAISAVIEHEAPIHIEDLLTRVAGIWGKKAGSRITARIESQLEQHGLGKWTRRGDFAWNHSGTVHVRTREQVRMTAERICPEEYREAAVLVLQAARVLSRPELIVEVRSVLGFNRTGSALEKTINDAIDSLLKDGKAGEASAGIALR